MKRQPAKHKTVVGVLGDPDPNFVSLVDNGANQRPFHSVKSANPKEIDMSRTEIHQIVFDPQVFTTEKAVREYLTGKGYTGFKVEKNDAGSFVVEDHPADAFVGELRNVPHSSTKGVMYIAGEVAGDDDDDAASQKAADQDGADANAAADDQDGADGTAAKAEGEAPTDGDGATTADADDAGTAAKSDDADAGSDADADDDGAADGQDAAKAATPTQPQTRVRRGLTVKGASLATVIAGHEALAGGAIEEDGTRKSFAEMLSCYNGSMPPGVYDMADALMGSIRKMFSDGDVDEAKVGKLATDFAGGVVALYDVYQDVLANKSVDGDDAEEQFFNALMDLLFEEQKAATGEEDATKTLAEQNAALTETVGALTTTVKSLKTQLDQLTLEKDEDPAKKSAPRVLGKRNGTDADEAADASKTATKAADKETVQRNAKRMWGGYAAKRLTEELSS